MALSIFADKEKKPTDAALREALERSSGHWSAIVEAASEAYAPLDLSWGYSGAAWGWSLRLKCKKRTVMYLTPQRRHFLVGLVLGDRAIRAARASDLPRSVLSVIAHSKKYAEGTGVRLEVRTKADREAALKLAAVKMAN